MKLPNHRHFLQTRMGLIQQANSKDPAAQRKAMEEISRDYWFPIYTYIRKTGRKKEDAEDLTQTFLSRLLDPDKNTFAKLEARMDGQIKPGLSTFRPFLLACIKNFLHDALDHATAEKRDSRRLTDFDSLGVENRYLAEVSADRNPDEEYEYQLAKEFLQKAEVTYEEDLRHDGKLEIYQAIRPHLYGEEDAPTYAALSVHLGSSIGTLKSHAYRMKAEYRNIILMQMEELCADPADAKDELRAMMRALQPRSRPTPTQPPTDAS